MNPRRVSAILCAVGALLIAWAILSPTWWYGRIESRQATADLKIGLVSLTGCTHDAAGVWRCQSADWKQIGVTPDSALWVWSGRLLFGVGVATAIGLAVTALLAGVPIDTSLPVSPQRLTIGFALAALALVGLYRISTPEGISVLLGSGRSWWMSVLGLVVGGVGVYRDRSGVSAD